MKNKYNYAILQGDLSTIKLSNKYDNRPSTDLVFENYKLTKTKISGKIFDYKFAMHSEDIELSKVDEKEIINKKFLIWKWKTYRKGWLLLKERKLMKIENPKGFILIEGDL